MDEPLTCPACGSNDKHAEMIRDEELSICQTCLHSWFEPQVAHLRAEIRRLRAEVEGMKERCERVLVR